jgi:very-short-patch-repair endonuclease
MTPEVAVLRLGGIASFDELRDLTTRRRLRTALARGQVIRVSRGLYALPAIGDAKLAAARLGGVVSHLSAALYWGWKVKFPPERPSITVPRRRSRLHAGYVEVHWADLKLEQIDHGVTTRVQTVIDCARSCPFDVAVAVADSALRAGVRREDLVAAAEASPRTGRSRALRVLKAADPRSANPFESVLKAIAIDVPGLCVEPQQQVGDVGLVDLLDKRLRLVIEADSFEFHSSRPSLARDIRRYTGFARLGYVVVRFTWEEAMFDADYVRAVLLDMVALGPAFAPKRRA